MTRYARIDGGIAREFLVTDADIATLFPPDLVWVACGDDVQERWLYVAGLFSAPPPPPVEIPPEWFVDAMTDLRTRRDRLLDVISGMQADYIVSGDMANAVLCRTVKVQLKAAPSDPSITGAVTRTDFNAAALVLWKTIAAQASPEVRAEFARYATAA